MGIKEKILDAEVVSFDIFDTLVERYTEIPTDLFSLVERKYNWELKGKKEILNFRKNRIKAEKRAREEKKGIEITLENIYDNINILGYDKETLMKYERELELLVCRPKKEILDLFKFCIDSGKKVIIVSDMYLNEYDINKILIKCGITGFTKLYLSSSIGYRKKDGRLFDFVLADLKIEPNKLLHIGDNDISDYEVPLKKGIQVWGVQKSLCNRQLFQKRKYSSVVVGGVLKENGRNIYHDIGKVVLGPLLYGFIRWIHQTAVKERPDKILFLSRDGAVMQKAYLNMYAMENIECSYVYASRRALIVPTLWENSSLENITRIIHFHDRMLVREFLERVGIGEKVSEAVLKKYGYCEDSRINGERLTNDVNFVEFYNEIEHLIICNSKNEYKVAKEYWRRQIGEAKKVFIVDIGWNGNMQNALDTLLADKKINIKGLYLGVNPQTAYDLDMVGYIYDKTHNAKYKNVIENFSGVLETFFMCNHGSLCRYTENIPYVELYPNEYTLENGRIINEISAIEDIQQGAIEFINEFDSYFKNLKISYELSDAISNLFNMGMYPSLDVAICMGNFRFFNSGISYLAREQKGRLNCKELINTNWRIGYMKRSFKYNLPYYVFAKFIKLGKKIFVNNFRR